MRRLLFVEPDATMLSGQTTVEAKDYLGNLYGSKELLSAQTTYEDMMKLVKEIGCPILH